MAMASGSRGCTPWEVVSRRLSRCGGEESNTNAMIDLAEASGKPIRKT